MHEVMAWDCDESMVFIGNGDTELCQSLVRERPALRVLSMQDAAAGWINSAAMDQPQLLLIDDEGLDPEGFRHLLALLRDTARGRLILRSFAITMSEALALGFRRLNGAQYLFVFDLFDYKQLPDWLNADHFAHPQRWGQALE